MTLQVSQRQMHAAPLLLALSQDDLTFSANTKSTYVAGHSGSNSSNHKFCAGLALLRLQEAVLNWYLLPLSRSCELEVKLTSPRAARSLNRRVLFLVFATV